MSLMNFRTHNKLRRVQKKIALINTLANIFSTTKSLLMEEMYGYQYYFKSGENSIDFINECNFITYIAYSLIS